MKIFITGNAGSGKTSLAKKIAPSLQQTPISLDKFVWLPNWQIIPSDVFQKNIDKVLNQDNWLIEGVSSYVLKQADIVIFLDVPRYVSYYRVLKRNWRYLFKSRPELPENCPEIKIIWKLFKIIWQFKTNVKPKILEQLEQHIDKKQIFHIKSKLELMQFIARFLNMKVQWNNNLANFD